MFPLLTLMVRGMCDSGGGGTFCVCVTERHGDSKKGVSILSAVAAHSSGPRRQGAKGGPCTGL